MRSLLLLTTLFATAALAALKQDGEGTGTFDAKGPAGFKIHGTAKNVTAVDDGKTTTVTVTMKDIDTDNSLRNKHLGEDMEAAKFPTITLAVPTDVVKLPEDGKSVDAEAKGTFTIHGVSKELPFKYTASTKSGVTTIDGSADVNLSDFGVKIRSYLGVTVKPDIVVGAHFALKKQ